MNKKAFFLLISLIFISAICLAGCSDNINNNKKPPSVSTDLLSPRVTSFGSFIEWDEAMGATDYEIYCNNKLKATVQNTRYRVQEVENDSDYYVIAVNKNTGEKTEKSNVVKVSKNCGFTSAETLDLSNRTEYTATVPSEVRRVIVGGKQNLEIDLQITLANRTNDIIFELNNVAVTGFMTTANGSYKRADNNYNVVFAVNGNCSFKGADGSDGFDFSDSVYDNTEVDAGSGSDGGSVFILSSVVVRGNGNFLIAGGNGGNGGVGSSTTKWEEKNGPGAGADGGDGGTAVKCAYLVVDMQNAGCAVSVADGTGGKKGTPGVNGSIITGPAASAMWKDMYDIGKSGKSGKSVIGALKIIEGKVNK